MKRYKLSMFDRIEQSPDGDLLDYDEVVDLIESLDGVGELPKDVHDGWMSCREFLLEALRGDN